LLAYLHSLLFLLQFLTSHFIISYPENIQQKKIEIIADFLENRYNFLSDNWKLDKPGKINVIFYATTYDFMKSSNSLAGLSGKYTGGKIHLQPFTLLEKKKILQPVLAHELVHAFLDEYNKNGLPKWMNEAFAVYFSDALERYAPKKKITLKHFEDLDRFLKEDDFNIKSTAYFYLGLTMQFYIITFPKSEIINFIKSFPLNGNDPYKSSFNLSKIQIEKKWKEYLVRF
jgi:hypothetical protein